MRVTDPETGETTLKPVVQTFQNETTEWIHVTANGETLTCTPNHPFYSPVKGWTSAIDLRAGDILVMLNGEYVVVEQVQHELLESPEITYNFEVEDYHTYYVGDEAVLVHNKCQNHHAISNKINRAKSSNPKLNCISRNDPRFQVKALTSDAHRGYQQWHRQYDDIMVNWLNKHPNASAGAFINKLNSVYSSANMVRRFGKVNFRL